MDALRQIIGDYHAFLERITAEIAAAGFDFADFSQMDHMCYRVTSLADYEAKKQALSGVARLLGEQQVNGRPIATFRLHQPVRYRDWRIDVLELPAPKADKPMPEGLDHVELVLFGGLQDFLQKHADKTFNLSAVDRGINPEVSFNLPSYTVKFHLLSLSAVVYLEQKLGITNVQNG